MNIEGTLKERSSTHGDFKLNSQVCQTLKGIVRHSVRTEVSAMQREALENICQKIARILTGDPNHVDNWHDIAGYATLIEQELTKRAGRD